MNQFTNDSGRSSLHRMYFQLIKEWPVLGYGLVGGWVNPGAYPHHIYIELLLSCGVVLGNILFAIVTFLAIKSIYKGK